jgi:hypothetical protein
MEEEKATRFDKNDYSCCKVVFPLTRRKVRVDIGDQLR